MCSWYEILLLDLPPIADTPSDFEFPSAQIMGSTEETREDCADMSDCLNTKIAMKDAYTLGLLLHNLATLLRIM